MYAIIETGGKQYRVQKNDEIYVELIDQKEGSKIELNSVLLVSDKKTVCGNPFVKGASVVCKVLKHGKQKKVIVFKYKAKNNDAVKKGHRQPYTKLKIEQINFAQ